MYHIFPEVQSINYHEGSAWDLSRPAAVWCSPKVMAHFFDQLPPGFTSPEVREGPDYVLGTGDIEPKVNSVGEQGYGLVVDDSGICLGTDDPAGFRYGLDTLAQLLDQATDGTLASLAIVDEPVLKNRGLMLDLSRGKVYTLDYLKDLAGRLAKNRYNILQLYTEHSFAFSKHPDISEGTDPLTKSDILELSAHCRKLGIELQANLQSLGHMRRILTRPAYRHLAESPLFWSLNTTDPAGYDLLDDLYSELLPLFDSPWVNVCCDEPYDLGRGKSSTSGKSRGQLYFDHLLKVHDLARRHGKKIMLFGDVIRHYPDLARQMPDDVLFLDWIYDPKETYGTPALFQSAGRPYWVSPGTGNWNTLFPRLDGSIQNIVGLTLEGIRHACQGMLLTDWNDHGAYTQASPAWYLYSYAAATAWCGKDPGKAAVDRGADKILDLPGYSRIIHALGSIYHIPPIWSQNRSQCVMALFDEPIRGAAVRGPDVPDGVKAFDMSLPPGVDRVLERHSHHPMRPVFAIPESARREIAAILEAVRPDLANLKDGLVKDQLEYIQTAFQLMLDKLSFSHRLISAMESRALQAEDWLDHEDAINELIRRYAGLQRDFTRLWLDVSKPSEIHLTLVYFSQIITRLDYLKDWLSIQREQMASGGAVDWTFDTYVTGGYTTLPTF